jgi:uncharacterized protein YndB with AHSA1/START domain
MVAKDTKGGMTLRLSRTLPFRRDRVFKAWTDPEELARWFNPTPEHELKIIRYDLRAGGSYALDIKAPTGILYRLTGTYREVKRPEKLVYTWRMEEGYPDRDETLVTVEFLERGEATEIVLTHEKFPHRKMQEDHTQGWNACFDRLTGYLQGTERG